MPEKPGAASPEGGQYLENAESSDISTNPETDQNFEKLIEGNEIGVATATFYPNWEPGGVDENASVDKVRGDLALKAISAAVANGYQVVVVDGGSSEAFMRAVRDLGADIQDELERGMSASRRQAFEAVSGLDGVKVICWTEPEKVSMTQDCIAEAVQPILNGEADIVVPRRDDAAFATYPDYQANFEKTSNHVWNDILRRHNLLPADAPDIDAWIGPRFFRNDQEIVELFKGRYEFISETQSGLKQDAPELWPNALFLPLVSALHKGYRVRGVDVPYRHPTEQAANEKDSDVFRQKRATQQENILKTTIHFIRYLEENPNARIAQA
ncbi:hypothetical protein KY386_02345 [Candidatus Parcubacteria bacterium]|nr:hypothetical protein [Candidatus Parcubacteria bacterium]